MKDSNTLIRRYTNTLYSLALKNDVIDIVYQDLLNVSEIINNLESYQRLALNPKVPTNVKIQIWEIIIEVGKVSELVKSFINLLIKNSRINFFPKILECFNTMLINAQGIKIIHITTSIKLKKSESDKILETLESIFNSKVNLDQRVDSSIIGGMILKYDSFMLDASIKSKLNTIESTLLK